MTGDPPSDPSAWMRDWMTIWQSEAAASGLDRELQENFARFAALWQQARPADEPSGRTRTDAASGTTSSADASDAGGQIAGTLAELRAELAQLRQRIETLETARPARRRPAGGH